MEGLEKFIPKNIIPSHDAETVEKILKVLSDLKVPTKVTQPLKLEFTITYLQRVIYHYAADEEILRLAMGKSSLILKSIQFSRLSTYIPMYVQVLNKLKPF